MGVKSSAARPAATASVRRTPLRDKRRRQCIDAAICVIGRYGMPQTTLARVGKAAGLSPSILNFYFTSKEQLLLETLSFVAAEYTAEVARIFAPPANPTTAVIAAIEMNFSEKICTGDKVAVWYAFSGESRARQDYLRICGEKDAECSRQLQRQFVDLCAQSDRPEQQATVLAAGLEGLIQNYWQNMMFHPAEFKRAVAIDGCLAYMHNLFPVQFAATAASPPPAEAAEKSDLLPVWTYQNREFFDLEVNEIFRRNWILTGHISDISRPGDYYTFDCFGERVLVVRDKQKRVQAFHNVCRHRGARLVQTARGNCPHRLTCPFHGWSYDLGGRLKMVPMSKTFSDLDKSKIHLTPVECDIWRGFIFIRLSGGGVSLSERLAPLEEVVAPYRPQDMLPIVKPSGEERPYNWKIIHDIDNEGYHVPVGHPGLQALYGGNYEDYERGGFSISAGYLRPPDKSDTWSAARYKQILPQFSGLTDKQQRCWLYIGIFPNLVLAFYPDMMEFYMTLPQTPERTCYYAGSYGLDDNRRAVRIARYLNQRINKETDTEDESFVDWMQSGLSSSAFPQFTLSAMEQGVRDFHKKIQAVLPVAELAHAPAAGAVAACNRQLSGRRDLPIYVV